MTVRWLGWAVERPGEPLFVQYGGDEADAWITALGWPDEIEIAYAKAHGARAFPVEIRERTEDLAWDEEEIAGVRGHNPSAQRGPV
jgi:hypothetical protein